MPERDWTSPEGIAELERLIAEAKKCQPAGVPAPPPETRPIWEAMWACRAAAPALARALTASREALAESQALLALYSGGRAGAVPRGWKAGKPYTVGVLALERDGRPVAYVGETGRIEVDGGGEWAILPGPRPVLQACAEAEAWLAGRGAP